MHTSSEEGWTGRANSTICRPMRRRREGWPLRDALCGAFVLGLIIGLPTTRAAAATDPVACVSENGTAGVCVDGTALDGATGVVVMP